MNDEKTRTEDFEARGAWSRRHFLLGTGAVTVATGASSLAAAADAITSIAVPKYEPLGPGKKLRIGVVGGNFGLAFPWNRHPNCEVTAVADLIGARRDALKKTFACDNVYAEFHPMLKDPKVDAVAIYTDGPTHAQYCIDIMKAGKHAVTVIPAAVTLEECQKLIDTVKSTGQIYMYAETGAHHPMAMASRELYKSGAYGDVYYTAGEYTHAVYSAPIEEVLKGLYLEGKESWRWGFPQGLYAGHAIGPIIHATRERYAHVSAIGVPYTYAPFKKNRYGNPFVNTTFSYRTASGKPSTIKVHWMTAKPGREGADIYGTRICTLEAREGLPASVCYPEKAPVPLDLSAYTDALPPELRNVPGHGGAHPHIIHQFVTACLTRSTPQVDVYQAAAISAAGIVGFHSALKNGELLEIPDFGPMA
jgi:predicted dehydrogenase